MSLRRVTTVAVRLILIAAVFMIVPACKKQQATDPKVKKATPDFASLGASHFPLMVIQWDRALDPSTVTTANIQIWTADALGNPVGAWAQPYSVEYIPGTFQTIIKNGVAFGDAVTPSYWEVLVFPGLTSDKGVAVNVQPAGGIALFFQVGTNANILQPSPSTPTQVVGGTSGQIVFNWVQATESGAAIANESYIFFGAKTSGGEDFLDSTPNLSVNDDTGAGTITGLTPDTDYHFRVVVRDTAGNTAIIGEFLGHSNP